MPALRRQNREVVFRPPRGGRAPGAGRMSALFLWTDGARGARDAAKRRKLPPAGGSRQNVAAWMALHGQQRAGGEQGDQAER